MVLNCDLYIIFEDLNRLIKIYETEELSLRDLEYFDEQFEYSFTKIRQLKNNIINKRFLQVLDNDIHF